MEKLNHSLSFDMFHVDISTKKTSTAEIALYDPLSILKDRQWLFGQHGALVVHFP